MSHLKHRLILILLSGELLWQIPVATPQDANILHPIEEIEQNLAYEPFEIFRFRPSRFEGDVTKRALLKYDGNKILQVKWKRAARGGAATNNQPRYEMAAYEIQKLFLDPKDYVVPPTACRAMPVQQYRNIDEHVDPTFKNTSDVLYVLQYWLENVGVEKILDKKRFDKDSAYARHLANMNILSYLIKHNDANIGNFLISTIPANPRVFAVDNGFAFGDLESNRGFEWRNIRVKRLPKETVDRLRTISLDTLHRQLGVVVQFKVQDGHLSLVEPGDNLDRRKGVRQSDQVIQFGLTDREIDGVYRRLQRLLRRIDDGKLRLF